MSDDTRFLTAEVSRLYGWWRGQVRAAQQAGRPAGMGSLPLRRAFDIPEHIQIVPDLFLVEVLSNNRFLMKLEGERVIELFGINNTGRIVSEDQDEAEYGHALAQYYSGVVEEGLCRRCVGSLDLVNVRRRVRFESIDCPLSREGGQVDFIIGVAVAVREPES